MSIWPLECSTLPLSWSNNEQKSLRKVCDNKHNLPGCKEHWTLREWSKNMGAMNAW